MEWWNIRNTVLEETRIGERCTTGNNERIIHISVLQYKRRIQIQKQLKLGKDKDSIVVGMGDGLIQSKVQPVLFKQAGARCLERRYYTGSIQHYIILNNGILKSNSSIPWSEGYITHSISNRVFCCFSCIIAMVPKKSPTVEIQ